MVSHMSMRDLQGAVWERMLAVLEEHGWQMSAAARALGVDRRTLYRWVQARGKDPLRERARCVLAGMQTTGATSSTPEMSAAETPAASTSTGSPAGAGGGRASTRGGRS